MLLSLAAAVLAVGAHSLLGSAAVTLCRALPCTAALLIATALRRRSGSELREHATIATRGSRLAECLASPHGRSGPATGILEAHEENGPPSRPARRDGDQLVHSHTSVLPFSSRCGPHSGIAPNLIHSIASPVQRWGGRTTPCRAAELLTGRYFHNVRVAAPGDHSQLSEPRCDLSLRPFVAPRLS